jgi:tetratricopeptide (TPR) repeat protein
MNDHESASQEDSITRTWLLTASLGFAIFGLAVWAYWGTLENGFVWDSVYYLRYSVNWTPEAGPGAWLWMLLSTEVANWHPLTWLSWAIDYRLFGGLDPAGFHLTNVILHGLNSLLVAWLAFALLDLHGKRYTNEPAGRTRLLLAAAFCGALFAVHPQHTQSVAWVAERKDLLCQLFMLAAILSYLQGKVSGAKFGGRTLPVIFFALAAMSKPMAVSLPLVLLILDHYPLRALPPSGYGRKLARLVGEKTSLFVIAGALALITILSQSEGGAMVDVPLKLRVLNAFNSIILYGHKFLWPVDFSPFYPYFVTSPTVFDWRIWLPVAGFALATFGAILAWRRGHPQWLAAWTFYLVTLFPVLGILQVGVQGAADRYAYLPTLPFYFLAAAGFLALSQQLGMSTWKRLSVWVAACVLLIGLAASTRQEVRSWNNALSLWTHAHRQFPEDHFVNMQLGITLLNLGLNDAAVRHFENAARLERKPTQTLAWRGVAYMRLGRYQEAMDAFIILGVNADLIPDLVLDEACVQYNIAWNMARLGVLSDSIDMFQRIDKQHELSHDAHTWITWLESDPDLTDKYLIDSASLPGQCEYPLPNYRIEGKPNA